MAGSKKIRRTESPKSHAILRENNLEQYYTQNPAWSFASVDNEMWTLSQEHAGNLFWSEILPRLIALESQTWGDILVRGKKQNHALSPNSLNKAAQARLAEKYIETESLISLRITGKHRLYGYMCGKVFCVLWFDDDHGDNEQCVCRSSLKHT